MEQLKVEIEKLLDEQIAELRVFMDGLLRGRQQGFSGTVQPATPKAPRKRSACSICHLAGHRAPTCPQKGAAA